MSKEPEHVEEVDAKTGTRVKGMTSVLGLSITAIVIIMIVVLFVFVL
ncbi:hypothetical protein [Litorimonas haliclonae]